MLRLEVNNAAQMSKRDAEMTKCLATPSSRVAAWDYSVITVCESVPRALKLMLHIPRLFFRPTCSS